VLNGEDQLPTESGTAAPSNFSAHVYCGKTSRWIKVLRRKIVGLSPGHIVLDGDLHELPSPEKGAQPPIFGPCLLWPNGCMDPDTTWYQPLQQRAYATAAA